MEILVKFATRISFAEVLADGRELLPTYLLHGLPEPPSEISKSKDNSALFRFLEFPFGLMRKSVSDTTAENLT